MIEHSQSVQTRQRWLCLGSEVHCCLSPWYALHFYSLLADCSSFTDEGESSNHGLRVSKWKLSAPISAGIWQTYWVNRILPWRYELLLNLASYIALRLLLMLTPTIQIGCRKLLRFKRDASASQFVMRKEREIRLSRKRGKGRYTLKRWNPADFEALAKTEESFAQKKQKEITEEKEEKNRHSKRADSKFHGWGTYKGPRAWHTFLGFPWSPDRRINNAGSGNNGKILRSCGTLESRGLAGAMKFYTRCVLPIGQTKRNIPEVRSSHM